MSGFCNIYKLLEQSVHIFGIRRCLHVVVFIFWIVDIYVKCRPVIVFDRRKVMIEFVLDLLFQAMQIVRLAFDDFWDKISEHQFAFEHIVSDRLVAF